MKIAVHTDAAGRPVSLYEDGVIHLYEGGGDRWSKIGEFAFALPDGASIPLVRGLVERVASSLRDCRTLISGDRNGYIYSLLGQEMGFSCWTSEGSLDDQLAMVERRQLEITAQQGASACATAGCATSSCGGRKALACGREVEVPPPENLGEGRLRVDVAAVMRKLPGLNSRQILFPLLEGGSFAEVEVICEHLPRWFAAKLAQLGLEYTSETLPGVGVIATITHPTVQ
ncbi:Fe-only nitrogenase accessory protein AnfO [Pleomorphomonas sp. PLEO]|uniref:Fe-only nitrogenase accessory protein AnfO n=1 Tax=Pleomorphomonas sp. PLEO TaxID=3239306 RepID=UPI00351EACF0